MLFPSDVRMDEESQKRTCQPHENECERIECCMIEYLLDISIANVLGEFIYLSLIFNSHCSSRGSVGIYDLQTR